MGTEIFKTNNYKAYYIMREDLNMSSAKLAVQIGHGTDMIWQITYDKSDWIVNSRKKIVCKVKTSDGLYKLAKKTRRK